MTWPAASPKGATGPVGHRPLLRHARSCACRRGTARAGRRRSPSRSATAGRRRGRERVRGPQLRRPPRRRSSELGRVLRPGGRLALLEVGEPRAPARAPRPPRLVHPCRAGARSAFVRRRRLPVPAPLGRLPSLFRRPSWACSTLPASPRSATIPSAAASLSVSPRPGRARGRAHDPATRTAFATPLRRSTPAAGLACGATPTRPGGSSSVTGSASSASAPRPRSSSPAASRNPPRPGRAVAELGIDPPPLTHSSGGRRRPGRGRPRAGARWRLVRFAFDRCAETRAGRARADRGRAGPAGGRRSCVVGSPERVADLLEQPARASSPARDRSEPARSARRVPPRLGPAAPGLLGPRQRGAGRDRSGRLDKLVLAREVTVHANRPFRQADLVGRLRALHPSCTTFAIDGFIGATPELLDRPQRCADRLGSPRGHRGAQRGPGRRPQGRGGPARVGQGALRAPGRRRRDHLAALAPGRRASRGARRARHPRAAQREPPRHLDLRRPRQASTAATRAPSSSSACFIPPRRWRVRPSIWPSTT